ncbi:MAG: hypothetical protein AB1745_23110 [Pseudomonadota bacterium]
MASVSLTESGLRTVKRALVARFSDDKSSHLSEALAAACGFRTHASLLAAVRESDASDPDFVLLDDAAFLSRREELNGIPTSPSDQQMLFDRLPIEPGTDVLKTISAKFRSVDYSKSSRRRAWRNAMVAGINAALSRRFFSLRPGDNRWPGAPREIHEQQSAHVFGFEIEGIPSIASLWDAGWDEISVHVALWPTDDAERRIAAVNAGFRAGDLFASGWLERRNGAWLQVSSDSGKNWSFCCRKQRLAKVAALQIRPAGYADRGSFAL